MALLCVTAAALMPAAVQSLGSDDGSSRLRFELPPAKPLAHSQSAAFPAPPGMEEVATHEVGDTPDQATPSGRVQFAAAFADLEAMKGDAAPPRAAAPGTPEGLLAVRFNLNDPYAIPGSDTRSGPIELKKGVQLNGTEAGKATIRVTEGATIAIARDDLRKLLSDAGRADLAQALPDAGFVNFDRVRQAGVDLRYDPIADRILVSG